MYPSPTSQHLVWNPYWSRRTLSNAPPPPTPPQQNSEAIVQLVASERLTLEGLQEQLVVGLDELQVGLLGCSHRGGARLVQAVGFCTSGTHAGGVASSRRRAGSVRSHPERPGRLSHLVPRRVRSKK